MRWTAPPWVIYSTLINKCKETSIIMNESALIEGIKSVGKGQRGSKSCTPELVDAICTELQVEPGPIPKAFFFTSLFLKGVSEDEERLLTLLPEGAFKDPQILINSLCGSLPEQINSFCIDLLNKKLFTRQQSHELGKFLFADSPIAAEDPARALVTAVLRMRYSEAPEYAGFIDAIQENKSDAFTNLVSDKQTIQIADPFDGVERSQIVTPLIANSLSSKGYNVMTMVGRNSGPKDGINLAELASTLEAPFIKSSKDLLEGGGTYGSYLHQKDYSDSLNHWVDIRRQIVKRPFVATLEKAINPVGADIFIGSAFHLNFTEKLVDLAEELNWSKAIVMFKSCEGTTGLSLARKNSCYTTKRNDDGSYTRKVIHFDPADYGFEKQKEVKFEGLTVEENAELIRNYLETGKSGNQNFDDRAKFTLSAYDEVFKYLGS